MLTLPTICSLTTLQYSLSTYSVPGPEDTVLSKTDRALSFYGIYNMVGRQTINKYRTSKSITTNCISAMMESTRMLEHIRQWEEGRGCILDYLVREGPFEVFKQKFE